jgi:hypothetical protein
LKKLLGALMAKREYDGNNMYLPKAKRTYIGYNCERARVAVDKDYFGISPIFQDHQFACSFLCYKIHGSVVVGNLFFG